MDELHDLASEPPAIGDTVGEKYRIEELLGRGGMGLVFQASHLITGKRFAIKWLLPDLSGEKRAIDRFIREAQVAGHVEHPNIVEVYDVGKAGGSFYMVMELLSGESLETRFQQKGAMSVREVVRIMLPCAHGLARAHAAGIVHRDLKPANIFLRRSPETGAETPKVLDFGISKMADAIGPNSAITKTGTLLGTPYYMAPEQVHARDVDARTDVYAFGVILYQLVGGRLPFEAPTYSSLLVKILTETPEPLENVAPDVPEAFARVVRRAMAREPESRFQSMHALISALERIEAQPLSTEIGRSKPSSRRPEVTAPSSRHRRGRRGVPSWAIAVGVTLLLATVLGLWLGRSGPAPRANAPAPTLPPAAVTEGAAESKRQAALAAVEAPPPAAEPAKPPATSERQAAPEPQAATPAEPDRASRRPSEPPAAALPRGVDVPGDSRAGRKPAASPPGPQPARVTPAAHRPAVRDTHPPARARPVDEAKREPPEPEPPEPEPRATPKSSGRLGVQMNKDDF